MIAYALSSKRRGRHTSKGRRQPAEGEGMSQMGEESRVNEGAGEDNHDNQEAHEEENNGKVMRMRQS